MEKKESVPYLARQVQYVAASCEAPTGHRDTPFQNQSQSSPIDFHTVLYPLLIV
jgi:hypothetical protein